MCAPLSHPLSAAVCVSSSTILKASINACWPSALQLVQACDTLACLCSLSVCTAYGRQQEQASTSGSSSSGHHSSNSGSSSSNNSSSSDASSGPASTSSSTGTEAAKPGLFDKLRAIAFFCWSLLLSVPLFVTMLTMAPFVMLMDKYK